MGPGNSFIGTNTGLGLALVMVIPLLLALAREEQRHWLRNTLRFTMACSVLSTPFTYSRGALLGLAATAPFMFLRSKRKLLVLLILVPLAFFAKELLPNELVQRTESIGEYKTDQSAQFRLQAWSVAWNIAKQRPFTGAGFNFEYGKDDERWLSYADFVVPDADNVARAAHSIYFQVLGQHGFLGLFLFVLVLVGSLWRLRRMRAQARVSPETEWIASYASAIQLGLVGFMVSGAFISQAYFDLVYTYFALIALLQRELAEHRAVHATSTGPRLSPVVRPPATSSPNVVGPVTGKSMRVQ
jgi:probable O-glycosylation ligase (exosortase A-associated)